MGKVKIFCECGKEIWQELPDWKKKSLTIWQLERFAMCSDCILEEVKEFEPICTCRSQGRWLHNLKCAKHPGMIYHLGIPQFHLYNKRKKEEQRESEE